MSAHCNQPSHRTTYDGSWIGNVSSLKTETRLHQLELEQDTCFTFLFFFLLQLCDDHWKGAGNSPKMSWTSPSVEKHAAPHSEVFGMLILAIDWWSYEKSKSVINAFSTRCKSVFQ